MGSYYIEVVDPHRKNRDGEGIEKVAGRFCPLGTSRSEIEELVKLALSPKQKSK